MSGYCARCGETICVCNKLLADKLRKIRAKAIEEGLELLTTDEINEKIAEMRGDNRENNQD